MVMGSLGNPKTWVPYENVKDCSQGFCSLYCPQWCYINFPPPPPYRFPEEVSKTNFSTLLIVIVGVLASAFLFGTYYIVISKYCGNSEWQRRRRGNGDPIQESNENDQNPSNHEPWQGSTAGLDDVSIKSIKAFRYKKGDGRLIEGTDCSVCLGEFKEDESLRLLPKCSHAFHLSCIDTWLKSHSSCPLCRANVDVSTSDLPLQSPRPVQEITYSPENQIEDHTIVSLGDLEQHTDEVILSNDVILKNLGVLEQKDMIIEIRGEGAQPIRRSTSMHLSYPNGVSIADILSMSDDEDPQTEDQQRWEGIGSSSKGKQGNIASLTTKTGSCIVS